MKTDWRRVLVAALFGYLAGFAGFLLLFGNPLSQKIIYTRDYGQTQKLLEVWKTTEPLPPLSPFWDRLTSLSLSMIPVLVLLFLWAVGLAWIYSGVRSAIPGAGWRKGIWFGFGVWIASFLFFETFTPLNLFGEPLHLIAYELVLEIGIAGLIGVTIAAVFERPRAG